MAKYCKFNGASLYYQSFPSWDVIIAIDTGVDEIAQKLLNSGDHAILCQGSFPVIKCICQVIPSIDVALTLCIPVESAIAQYILNSYDHSAYDQSYGPKIIVFHVIPSYETINLLAPLPNAHRHFYALPAATLYHYPEGVVYTVQAIPFGEVIIPVVLPSIATATKSYKKLDHTTYFHE